MHHKRSVEFCLSHLLASSVALTSFVRSALHNKRLTFLLVGLQMAAGARALEAVQASLSNAVDDLCGTPCQDVVDASSVAACAIRWVDGCGDVTPPDGFTSESTVAELCPHACAFYLMKSGTV
eukprot:2158520-Pleurochrysis_carterae.AAC.1